MSDIEDGLITNAHDLAALYAAPSDRIAQKAIDHVNHAGRAFIAASPFLILATGTDQGFDCSPKGDHPGFVKVSADGRMLLIPDRRGNNRIDSLRNLVENSRIAVLFFVPGVNETFRVNGRARISQDENLKRQFIVNNTAPTIVLIVTVEEAFQHCAKALVRADLWKVGARGRPSGVPTMGDFVAARYPGTDSQAFDASYTRQIPGDLY